ncbi:helix-turn-helix domain-containing protein [Microbacterium luteum]|uniref:helix-turn-helix domain-containing protein n=1 Tax=Microbacterium luteum TaxID=2782167 RepID=UPI0018886AFA|nr:helix-turn-helix transcriptional regulator [Microbacterium luteum]
MAIETNADVARRVRGLAAEKQIKQSALAAALHVSRMAMWRRTTGETPITAQELIVLARVIGVPVAAFYSESPVEEMAVAS